MGQLVFAAESDCPNCLHFGINGETEKMHIGSRGSNKDSGANKREHVEVLEAKELSVPSGLVNPKKRVLLSGYRSMKF